MSAILASLAMLLGGAALSAMLSRMARLALMAGVASIIGASIMCLIAAWPCLAHSSEAAPTTLAWPTPLGEARLALDGLSAWFLVTIALLSSTVALYAWSYMQAEINRGPVPALAAFLCILVAALILVVTAADAVLFLIGWETMMLASFFLVSFHHRRREVRRAAWIYLIANHLGTALFVLPLFGMLAAKAGTLDFQFFRAALQGEGRDMTTVLFLLGLFGFGTKAGFMPMHIWLPVAHPAAPTPVSALLSGVVIKAGIYGLLRLLSWLPALPARCAIVMLVFGMVSGCLGVLYALAQHDIKRLLAYHSIENIGIIGLGIGMGMLGQSLGRPALVALGYGGALLHVLNHALFKGLLFLSAGAVMHATGTGDIERLGGLARMTPVNAGLFLLGAVSICGLPPFNGFVSEWMVFGSLLGGTWGASRSAAGMGAMGAISLALMGGLALACFAKVFGVVFLGEPRGRTLQAHATPPLMGTAMFVPAILCAGIGILPGVFVPLAGGGVRAVAGMGVREFGGAMQPILTSVTQLSLFATLLAAIIIVLLLLNRILIKQAGATVTRAVMTWGCAYAKPSARMQYTASSFAWSLIQSFRSLLWPQRKWVAPVGLFTAPSELETHTPDMAEQDVFAPLMRGAGRVFRMIRTVSWTGEPALRAIPVDAGGRARPARVLVAGVVTALRQGRIHVYLAFIVFTLLAVFIMESLSSRPLSAPGSPVPISAPAGGGIDDGGSK
ncbi:MAG: hypothetical protein IT449_08430 [Phycisphaerales bacterium]|nr:hypothetical protein [Phycisphaerales bacterium]